MYLVTGRITTAGTTAGVVPDDAARPVRVRALTVRRAGPYSTAAGRHGPTHELPRRGTIFATRTRELGLESRASRRARRPDANHPLHRKESTMRRMISWCLVSVLSPSWGAHLAPAPAARQAGVLTPASPEAARLARLESSLESLRQDLKIPALSAAVVKDQKVLWARGFGYADPEKKIPATEHTPYHLASLTKTFASTVLMRLVQDGKVGLDDPVSKYGINLESDGVIRVKHLLSHTSEGNPGERYRYNGNRFAELDKVVQRAAGKSFGELLIANILEPLGMNETAPNVPRVVGTKSPGAGVGAAEAEVKAAVLDIMAGFNSGDVDKIERRLAPGHNGFQGEGGFLTSFIDAADLRGAFQSGFKLKFEVHDLEAAVYGDTAVTTFFMSGTVTRPNSAPRADGPWRSSFVWNRQDGVWKLVHSHQSAIDRAIVTE